MSHSPNLVAFHTRVGWWGLFLFIGLGFALEIFLGLKIDAYLNVENETRRLMWRLAHAHGGLVSLLHLAFAATLAFAPTPLARSRVASPCLLAALLLLPGGFFLGGFGIQEADPGIGVFLAPLGALLLMLAVLLIGWDVTGRKKTGDAGDERPETGESS